MSISIDKAQQELEEALAPYGYYFARKGRETELPLTFAELGLFALAVLAWGAVEYAKSFIQERAKLDAQRLSVNPSSDIEQLKQQLNEVLDELRCIRDQVDTQQNLYEFRLSEEELTAYLQNCGLSKRASGQLTQELRPLLESQIQLLVMEIE